ncbi:NAD(P)-binding protein [Cylindrobasidium torrendii FP15055 ss-10]|uniref:NAD(P)-binding protein n=1 Tax=Cylindrobasidium torrendii FP15055 ss-10 TaxID=1314674 RepID=A0A0D7B2X6_9AGAR|nr:NAD(P)-binding protein [Cylindrobasidium torrendii FP15055 ss-10]
MLFGQPPVAPLPDTLDFTGQTILVTGANTGLGYSIALTYLQRGASTLIIGVRSKSKGETAREELLSDPVVASRTVQPVIDICELDMVSEKSVAAFAGHVKANYPVLHVAILNAGVFTFAWDTAKETGRETTIQVNYVSTVLLGLLLLPHLKATSKTSESPARLTFIGSERALVPHFNAPETKPILDSLAIDPKAFDGQLRYAESKLLLASFIKAYSAGVDPAEVIVNNMCPGAVATNLARDAPWYFKPVIPLFYAIKGARTPEVGARLVVRAAATGKESHGQLLSNDKILRIPFTEGDSGRKFNERLRDETLRVFEKGGYRGI